MYSDRITGRLLLTAAFIALLAGCGNKENPQPPPLKIPAPTTDLTIQQRGTDILLTAAYPTVTVAGVAIEELKGVEFWHLEREVPPPFDPLAAGDEEGLDGEEGDDADEDAEEGDDSEEADEESDEEERTSDDEDGEEEGDEAEDGEDAEAAAPLVPAIPQRPEDRVQVELLEFAVTSKLDLYLQQPELQASTLGDRIHVRIPTDEPEDDQEIAYFFATRILAGKRLASNWSNLVMLVRRPPPPPVTNLEVEATGGGIELSWESDFEDGMGFRIYRRDARSRGYSAALRQLPADLFTFIDRTASYGNSYIYAVTAIGEVNPLVESALGGEREVNYEDRFGPAAPRNLVALAQTGEVRLIWDATTASDVQGYFVQRRARGGEPVTLNEEPTRQLEFTDTTVEAGRTYLYSVFAIDQAGNSGKASEAATARVP